MNQYLELLPPRVRQVVYVVYAGASVGLSGTSAYYLAAFGTIPTWVVGTLAALGAVGAGPTLLAAAKVNGLKTDEVQGADPFGPGLVPLLPHIPVQTDFGPSDFGPVDTWTPGVDEEPAV
jgi:hypothetical protein